MIDEQGTGGPVDPVDYTFTCKEIVDGKECGRVFKSQPALNMHRVRKHSGKTWSTTGNFAGTDKGAKRKAYKKKYDLRKKAERLAPTHGVNFCPECGCNLQVYNVARAAAERLSENA